MLQQPGDCPREHLPGLLNSDLNSLDLKFYFVPAVLALPLTMGISLAWALSRLGPAGFMLILGTLLFLPVNYLCNWLKSLFQANLDLARHRRSSLTRQVVQDC